MLKENTVLTIDVGGASIKMAEFAIGGSGDSVTLERYAIKEFTEELNDSGFAEAFTSAFRELMAQNQFKSTQVRLSISSLHSFQRLSKLPPLSGNRSRATQVVEAEAKQTVPYPLDEVIWDYQLIKHIKYFEVKPEDEESEASQGAEKTMDSVEELEALFVAVKDELVTAICTTLLDAGLEVLSVEVTPTAVYNAAKANMMGENGCDMILDMGGRGSNLIFIDGGRIFLRAIPIGGNTITQQIAKEFSIDFADAEEMKRKHCFVALGGAYEDSDSQVAATISKIARNVMTRLHGEINRSINAWRSLYDGNRPQALYITGGSSIIPYVPHFLNEKLHLEVSFLNTFPVIAISDIVDKEALLEVAHLFPPMIGLGIRHIRTCPVEISLIPKIIRNHRELQKKKPFFYLSAVSALLCLLVFYGGVSARMHYDRRLEALASDELGKTEEIAKQIKNMMRQYNTQRDAYDSLRRIVDARSAWPDILNELQRLTPGNMWFTEVDGLSNYTGGIIATAPRQGAGPGMGPGNPGMGPGMGPGNPGMGSGMPGMDPSMPSDGMVPGMEDPMMGMGGPSAAPVITDVTWLRLKGHSLVMDQKAAEGVEEAFRKNVAKSELFDHDPASYKNPKLTVNSGNNNITSFVIYVKLKNPIKQ